MVKVDDTTSRYVDTNRLAIYNKFQITAAKCMVTAYDGKQVIVEARLRAVEAPSRRDKMPRIPITTTGLSARERA